MCGGGAPVGPPHTQPRARARRLVSCLESIRGAGYKPALLKEEVAKLVG